MTVIGPHPCIPVVSSGTEHRAAAIRQTEPCNGMFLCASIVSKHQHMLDVSSGHFSFAVHLKEKLTGHPLISLHYVDFPGRHTVTVSRFDFAIDRPRSEKRSEFLVLWSRLRSLWSLSLSNDRTHDGEE